MCLGNKYGGFRIKFNRFSSLASLLFCMNKMIPSKSERSESRRSSILKPRKPRQPLQNVNFDSSSNENSPVTSKVKRRVSFAEKKHVKEFCHSTEQGTVWDNTYEEHDSSLKGSFVVYQNTEVESKENSCTSNNDCILIHSESNSCYPNNAYLVNNQLLQESVAKVNEEDDDTNCNLDFVNSVKPITSNKAQLGDTALPNKSCVSKDTAVSSGIVEYSDTDEECMELPNEESQPQQTVTNISCTSETVKSSNITIYRDSDEEDYADNVVNKYSSKLCSNNVNSELDKTRVQDLSIELTAPISTLLLSSHLHAEQEGKKHNDISNLDTNYTTNYNNVSMEITEAIPLFAKSIASNLEISEQIPTILQKCDNIKCDATNIHKTTDVNYINDSMVLTSVIQPFTDTDTCCTNNPVLNTSMEITSVPSKICGKNACNENLVKEDDLRKDQSDKTKIFNDVLMEMTKPVNTILSSSIYNKENFRMDELISKGDRTVFYDVSMEMTKIVPTKSKQEIVDTNVNCIKSSEKNAHGEEDVNISLLNEGTKTLYKSMEFTEAVPAPLHYERMFYAAKPINKSICEDYKNDRTEFFNDASMELTKSVNMLPLNIDKENLKSNESISKDSKTMFFHNVSMEMTTALSRNQNEVIQPITHKSIFKENTQGEKDSNNSTCCNEETRLLCKSMEFTEVVPISLHERTFNTAHTTTQSTFSQTLSKTTSLPAENYTGVTLQTDVDKTIQDISISAAALSTLQLMQNVKINKIENDLIISKDDELQHLTANNLIKPNKSITKENLTISKEIIETENIRRNELSNVIVIQSSLDNSDHCLNANFENVSDKKEKSDTSARLYSKKVRDSFIEIQFPQENDIHLCSSANVSYVNDIERKECFVKDITAHVQVSDSNLRDSLDKSELSEHSFLKKNLPYLENSLIESIKPPSFVCLDSEEEGSLYKVQSSTNTDMSVNNTSNQLIINNLTESKYLEETLINTEVNQTENCYKSTMVDKTEDNQKINCHTIRKTIINDNQSNKSNATKNINEENLLSNTKNGKVHLTVSDINHCTAIIKKIEVTEDQIDERKHIRKRLNEDVKLQNDIKEREHLDKKRQKTDDSDYLENIGTIIENQIDSEECSKNLNDKVKQQSIEKGECATKRLVTGQYINTSEDIKNKSLTEQDPFLTLSQELEAHTVREDCIWNVYYKNIDKKMIVFGFMSNSLLIATSLSYDFNCSRENLIKEIKIISCISDDAGILIRIAHKLILEKINTKILTNLYRTHHDILPLLNFISQDVKLAMDFMFDLRRLDDLNLMEIDHDEISFVSRSKRMDIILKVTIKVKQFDKLTSNDINLCCLLGRIKETDIKNLIKNVKRDHKFLRRYMNDVKDYIDIIEETQTL